MLLKQHPYLISHLERLREALNSFLWLILMIFNYSHLIEKEWIRLAKTMCRLEELFSKRHVIKRMVLHS